MLCRTAGPAQSEPCSKPLWRDAELGGQIVGRYIQVMHHQRDVPLSHAVRSTSLTRAGAGQTLDGSSDPEPKAGSRSLGATVLQDVRPAVEVLDVGGSLGVVESSGCAVEDFEVRLGLICCCVSLWRQLLDVRLGLTYQLVEPEAMEGSACSCFVAESLQLLLRLAECVVGLVEPVGASHGAGNLGLEGVEPGRVHALRHGRLDDPGQASDVLTALFGADEAAGNWHEHYLTWRAERIAQVEKELGSGLDEVAEFLADFAARVKALGPSGYLRSLSGTEDDRRPIDRKD